MAEVLIEIIAVIAVLFALGALHDFIFRRKIGRRKYIEYQIELAKSRSLELGITHNSTRNKSKRKKLYRGDIYFQYINSSKWKTISAHATKIMNGKCEFCGKDSLAVHHIYYPDKLENYGFEGIAALCVVCKKCHDVLHGLDTGTKEICPLCRKSKSNQKLGVSINKLGKTSQLVCRDCKLIATGFRDEVKKWTLEEYKCWVSNWQENLLSDLARNIRDSSA